MFIVGNTYTKNQLYEILGVPLRRQRGMWDTGYREYEGNIYIFSNVGIPGRTGHNYNNYWDGDLFVWEAINTSHINQPLIKRMINSPTEQKIYLFTRVGDRDPFTYEGTVNAKEFLDITPVKIIWQFTENPYNNFEEIQPSVSEEQKIFYEGSVSKVRVNKYERNPLARRIAIDYYGCWCNICLFDFFKKYGEWGKNYIQVHHIIPLATISQKYILKPEEHLIPVCPNCHCMIHKKKEALSVNELKEIFASNNG